MVVVEKGWTGQEKTPPVRKSFPGKTPVPKFCFWTVRGIRYIGNVNNMHKRKSFHAGSMPKISPRIGHTSQ
jgi:hypothetical protein